MKIIIIILICLFLCGCGDINEMIEDMDKESEKKNKINAERSAKILFVKDGIAIYSFNHNGYTHYYGKTENGVFVEKNYSTSNGKIRKHETETIKVEETK